MNQSETIKILNLLKENFEKGWECQGRCPREQMEAHAVMNPDGEKIWRQLYIEALTTAIEEKDMIEVLEETLKTLEETFKTCEETSVICEKVLRTCGETSRTCGEVIRTCEEVSVKSAEARQESHRSNKLALTAIAISVAFLVAALIKAIAL